MDLLKPEDKLKYKVQSSTQSINLHDSIQAVLPSANKTGFEKMFRYIYSYILY